MYTYLIGIRLLISSIWRKHFILSSLLHTIMVSIFCRFRRFIYHFLSITICSAHFITLAKAKYLTWISCFYSSSIIFIIIPITYWIGLDPNHVGPADHVCIRYHRPVDKLDIRKLGTYLPEPGLTDSECNDLISSRCGISKTTVCILLMKLEQIVRFRSNWHRSRKFIP